MKRTSIVLLASLAASTAQAGGQGFFVVVGSYPQSLREEAADNASRVVRASNRCGYKPSVGSSDRMIGMKSGYFIQVIGPLGSEDEAELVRNDVRRCVPDAYIKRGVYVPLAKPLSYRGLDD
jgi:hypothetical protein